LSVMTLTYQTNDILTDESPMTVRVRIMYESKAETEPANNEF